MNKMKILQGTTIPTVTYGAQTWTTTKRQEGKIRAAQRNMERKIAGIRWEQEVSNERLRDITGGKGLGYVIKELKIKYAGPCGTEKRVKIGKEAAEQGTKGKQKKKWQTK